MFQFKNYCWVLGNTAFHVYDLKYKNELQLRYLTNIRMNHGENCKQRITTFFLRLASRMVRPSALTKMLGN